ncbi:MAG: anti-sigma factor family protein [Labedaea sp.]
MVDQNCVRLRELSAELALGVLPAMERAEAVAHLQRCPACEQHVRELTALGDRLVVELVPGVEPPVGFEQRVLARFDRPDPSWRRRVPVAVAAALLALAIGALGWIAHGSVYGADHELVSAKVQAGGQEVGEAFAYTDPRSWLYVELATLPANGTVACQVRLADGRVFTTGSFPITAGSGSWGGPVPLSGVRPAEIRILAADGTVLGSARFG